MSPMRAMMRPSEKLQRSHTMIPTMTRIRPRLTPPARPPRRPRSTAMSLLPPDSMTEHAFTRSARSLLARGGVVADDDPIPLDAQDRLPRHDVDVPNPCRRRARLRPDAVVLESSAPPDDEACDAKRRRRQLGAQIVAATEAAPRLGLDLPPAQRRQRPHRFAPGMRATKLRRRS